jgi:hypothetical protein
VAPAERTSTPLPASRASKRGMGVVAGPFEHRTVAAAENAVVRGTGSKSPLGSARRGAPQCHMSAEETADREG